MCLKTFFYRTGHGQKVMGKGMGDCGMTVGEAFGISDILRDASPSSRAEIMSFACIKRYEKGQHVFYDSEGLSCFYIISSIRKVKFKTKKNNQANGCSLNNNKFFFGNISQIVNIFYKVNLKNLCSCVIIAVIALTFSSDNSG